MSWNLQSSMLKEVAQSLQEGRKNARSVENIAMSFIPLSDDKTREVLQQIASMGSEASRLFTVLYSDLAPHAFGKGGEK